MAIGVTYGDTGYGTPTFWAYDKKITATFPHPAIISRKTFGGWGFVTESA